VKYGRGAIKAVGKRFPDDYVSGHPYLGPSYRPRNLAFVEAHVTSEMQRLDWQMRELIVQKGLVRARLHEGVTYPAGLVRLFHEPDRLYEQLERIATAFALSLHNMTWNGFDGWSDPYRRFALTWADSHAPQIPPPGQPVRFAIHIRPLFRNFDIAGMLGETGIDLAEYATVKRLAQGIYQRLTAGDMPCDIPWPNPLLQLFRRWIDDGSQP
jgi:hypothetical protein